MESVESITLIAAFAAGVLSFLSPCVLPLVPSYVSFITGMSLEDLSGKPKGALVHASLFIVGFTTIFVLLGASASAAGHFLSVNKEVFERVGGALILLFGLYMFGLLNIGFLARERRVHIQDKPTGYLGSILVGFAFGAGWTPCIGPVLGSILAYTGAQGNVSEGLWLLFAYSMGLAVPFMLSAAAVDKFMHWFQKYRRFMPVVNKVSGGVLMAVGLLMVTGYFSILAGWLAGLTPAFLLERI